MSIPEHFKLPDSPITLRDRVVLTHLLTTKPHYRELILERCKEDKAFFINLFGFTFDPREGVEIHDIPFMMDGRFRYQLEMLDWLDTRVINRQDGIIEKSRDMGATWVFVAWLVHNFLFKDGFQALIGSRKEDLVDNWTLDSHFGKIDYFLGKLPRWMLPKGFNLAVHRMKLKVVNPENGNVIIGESANANFSRQGRYTCIIFDEAAFWEDLASSFRAAAQASPTRILISTPGGSPDINVFAEERFSGRHTVLTLHYSLDPFKDEKWAAEQRARMSIEDAAQELDINYHRSGRGLVYPEITKVPQGLFPFKQGYALYVAWDFGVGDDTAMIWIARNPKTGKARMIDCYSNNNKPIDFYIPFVLGYIPDGNNYTYSEIDMEIIHDHSFLPRAIHVGDPDVHKRSMSHATSAYQMLVAHGITIITNSKDKSNEFAERKRKTDLGIRNLEGINMPNCMPAYTAIANARFPQRSAASQSTSGIAKPIHDGTAHYRSAFEYYYVNEPPLIVLDRPSAQRVSKAYDTIGG